MFVRSVILLLMMMVVLAADAESATIVVNADGTGDYPTIQDAINNATAGDEVVLQPGNYTGDGNRDISFGGKAITVRGSDPDNATIVTTTTIDCMKNMATSSWAGIKSPREIMPNRSPKRTDQCGRFPNAAQTATSPTSTELVTDKTANNT